MYDFFTMFVIKYSANDKRIITFSAILAAGVIYLTEFSLNIIQYKSFFQRIKNVNSNMYFYIKKN